MAALIPQKMFDEQLAAMDIENFAQATIRQVGAVGGALEKNSGTEFLHLEMGVPGLPPETVGVEAEQQALAQGHASIYPSITGIAPLKSEASRFVKAFLDIDVAPEGCIPTVGSMQGSFTLFLLCRYNHKIHQPAAIPSSLKRRMYSDIRQLTALKCYPEINEASNLLILFQYIKMTKFILMQLVKKHFLCPATAEANLLNLHDALQIPICSLADHGFTLYASDSFK